VPKNANLNNKGIMLCMSCLGTSAIKPCDNAWRWLGASDNFRIESAKAKIRCCRVWHHLQKNYIIQRFLKNNLERTFDVSVIFSATTALSATIVSSAATASLTASASTTFSSITGSKTTLGAASVKVSALGSFAARIF